ncbi:Phycocyanobilin:ferredoxin oxidoreductase [Tetrabaena socialis]|uniref:Phycocyanobilin:ferredoxin oxidoreductase n=1 Tax=Tetrabaena socialis TaxID=47790 RepID=A0A2J7ZRU6_9CHLO|nr:Phycocyanobilin:ferredoxin oxidoreductase [Tetrabaena socialis]|eukprot:PNH02975.1 Phycocyanobilin:ferredoxin oxidoreductase [Tetrabaena socialis]
MPDHGSRQDGRGAYPRLLLENRVYCSKIFRKLHVEIGMRQDGLQVLHVTIFPRYSYDLPIFGLDIVMVEGRTTLAVVDCCPLRKDLKLPAHYLEGPGRPRFCAKNLVNKKTRRVLEVAFGQEWSDAYMTKLMFDFDPSYEPPFFDASFERLYEYFDENPEFGELTDEAVELEVAAEGQRAVESLETVLSGRPVSHEKLNMAMEFLYQSDPMFRAAVKTLSGDKREGMPDARISKELLAVLNPGASQFLER